MKQEELEIEKLQANKEIIIWLIILGWITSMSLWLHYGDVVKTPLPRVITATTTIIESSTRERVYFVDKDKVQKLPFCALNWDSQTGKEYNSDWCYDFGGWGGYDGVKIIDLNSK